ncbi:aldehyde ferredoxin oxidoreductase family protein, partial [Chloroflexota bacterium]
MKYSTKILVVDLNHKKSSITEVDSSVLRAYIGGAGLGAKILWDETSHATGPFSPENRLIFMIGPLTGKVPQSSRALVCGLSPLNNAWGEAAMGGSWGSEFSNTGFSGIIVSGRTEKPVYLYIKDKEVSINDASHLWGKDTFEVSDILQKETDEKASVAAIGQAGENQSRIAGIVCDGRFGRVAARCGLGGVMGSKNLKAVVVRGTGKQKAVDEAGLRAANKVVTQLLTRIKSGALGPLNMDTNGAIARLNSFGTLGAKNKSMGRWDAFREKFHESFEQGEQYHCRLCPTSCIESHVIHDTRQMVLHMIMSVGSNCLIDNVNALQQGYELCNRYGIDTISFGYTLSFAMEAYERGLINQKDTGGIDLTWGNRKAMLEVLRQIGENEGFGKVLGQGSLRAAQQIGGEALQYAMHVKGLEVPYFDPRIFNSLAIAYATGNRGGSHYESPSHHIERRNPEAGFGIDLAEFGYPQGVSRLGLQGKA